MNRLAELLEAVEGVIRAAESAPGRKLFSYVRVERDPDALADLIFDRTTTLACTVGVPSV